MMLGKQITLNDMESVVSKQRSLPRAAPAACALWEGSRDHVVVTAIFMGVAIQYGQQGLFKRLTDLPKFFNKQIILHIS